MKRTNMTTYELGKRRRVYEDKDGRLYYKACGVWHGTWRSYCEEDD